MSGARALEWPGCKAIGTTLPEVGFGGPAIGNRQTGRIYYGRIVAAALNLARGRVTASYARWSASYVSNEPGSTGSNDLDWLAFKKAGFTSACLVSKTVKSQKSHFHPFLFKNSANHLPELIDALIENGRYR